MGCFKEFTTLREFKKRAVRDEDLQALRVTSIQDVSYEMRVSQLILVNYNVWKLPIHLHAKFRKGLQKHPAGLLLPGVVMSIEVVVVGQSLPGVTGRLSAFADC